MKKLVIVESPTKAKTIGKFLGKEFQVESSYGHIRDLPKNKLGIEVEKDFKPQYEIPPKAKPRVLVLKEALKKSSAVILATDEDREGEAIAWHLAEVLGLNKIKNSSLPKTAKGKQELKIKIYRIVFHEITKPAIEEALKNPREIDMNLVNAQQARRVLDRLVGYELSPFLWHKVRYGLSAGRVQSVAVRLVVEREREIQNFQKQEYWTIEGKFLAPKSKIEFPATLASRNGLPLDKLAIRTEAEAKQILANLQGAAFRVADISFREVNRFPAAPFTTSTLQQEAARKLGFSVKQTMVIAQKLYEKGHITYMRTDSVHLSEGALAEAAKVITREFGAAYSLPSPRRYSTKSKGAQEAHEAIRPTNLEISSGKKLGLTDRGELRLYDLIWKRTIASQMKEALFEQTAVNIEASTPQKEIFRATGQIVKFDGFIRVYSEGKDEEGNHIESQLPKLNLAMPLRAKEILPIQHFTEPPPRYSDATLVKALETEGVGRPSTYAPILSVIQERGYVEKIEKKYHPTEIGFLVNDLLVEHFPEIVDIKFTSHVEEELDEIAEGKISWVEVCREFYGPFKKHLDEKEISVKKHVEVSDIPCPHCQKPMLIKFGRMGKFFACPEGAKVTLPMPEEAALIKELEEKTKDERCPVCGKQMKVRRGRFGFFLGCTAYPKCKGIAKIWNKTGFKCPACLASPVRKNQPGDIVEKKSRGRKKSFYACTRYPACEFSMSKKPATETELKEAFARSTENNNKKGKVTEPPRKQ